ncbi:NACHT domain-containing protein [Crinalium epipsammum]|uniref:NACHT domain-containing protein n=1 Tax=Crinalium epipsammum TaxID=241425 RepID=UPI0002F4E43D|nr:NACHT domain-containing protein [Crinalium epipsammum]
MERQDYRVQRPWSATLAQPSHSPLPLAAGTRIVEVFDRQELARQLLILGEPGAGKTTMMLELAEDLLQRAIADKAEPIPVLVSLSSWKNPGQPIFEWLVGELKGKYGIRQDLAQRWLKNNQLLPLLDGLDEVTPQHQQACAVALNTWLTGEIGQRPSGLLICCRREEFEQVVRRPLNLYGAIYLQALTVEQIEDYFAQFELQDVWQTVQQDEALQELLTRPLFLSMFGLVQTQGKFSLSVWRESTTSERKIEYLLDTYWDATITRELIIDPNEKQQDILSKTYGTKPLPTRKAVQRALVFAAKMLECQSSTELLIEKMQPTALIAQRQKWAYLLIKGLIIGLIIGLIFGLIGLMFGLIGLIFGLMFGLMGGLDTIEPVDEISISISHEGRREIVRSLRIWLIFGLIFGLSLELSFGLMGGSSFGLIGLIVLIEGLIIGLIIGLIKGLIKGLKADIQTRIDPNQGMKNSVKNMVVVSAIALMMALSFKFLLEYLLASVVGSNELFFMVEIALVMLIWSSFYQAGGNALSKHLALRLVLAWNGYAPLRYDLLLNYCTERLLLQRIGGRYRFLHKLLQDHFAKMDLG